MHTASAFVVVRCRGCDTPRTVSRRQARRAGLCNNCRYPPNEIRVDDKHRRFWFDRFTDHELALLASEFSDKILSRPHVITQQRLALTASASRNGVVSAGEREPHALLSPPR